MPWSAIRSILESTSAKLNFLQSIYLVYCTHKLKTVKSRFPRSISLLYCSRLFFELLRYWFEASWPGHQLLPMWEWSLDEQFTILLPISQFISLHTCCSPNLIPFCIDNSTDSIHFIKPVVYVFKDPHGLIWPMILTMQMWFMMFFLLRKILWVPYIATGMERCLIIGIIISRI